MPQSYIQAATQNGVLTLTIHRPEALNALNGEVIGQLAEAIDIAQTDDTVRVIVLTGSGEKAFVAGADIKEFADFNAKQGKNLAQQGQDNLFNRAAARTADTTRRADTWDEFLAALDAGGFVSAHWDGTSETEDLIKQETKATIRCIPLDAEDEAGTCIRTGAPSARRVLFARAY